MRTRKELRKYQVRAVKLIKSKRRLGLFVDIALGKTVIDLTAALDLMALGKLPDGVLVVAPINVTKDTWQNEAKKWEHLKHLKFLLIDERRQKARYKQIQQKADVKIISYTLLPWLARMAKKDYKRKVSKGVVTRIRPWWLPNMLILDESEFIKGKGAWFKAIRYHLMKHMKYRIIQSGTPASHSLFDLWPQIFVLDRGKRLGSAFDRYRSRFFTQENWQGYRYEPRRGAEKKIYSLLDDIIMRLDGDDWLELPKVVPDNVYVDLPPRAMELYRKHEREMFIQLDNLKEVEAINAAVLSGQCWQLANGAIYDDPEERDSWHEVHNVKITMLKQMIEEAVGNPVCVAYWFRHDRERLRAAFPKMLFMNKSNIVEYKDAWNKGKIELLAMNPVNSSHGVEMQYGGHMLFWFSQIWSGGKHNQLIGRFRRPDQRSKHVISRYLTAKNTVDEVIADSRNRRLRGQKALLDALNKYRRKKQDAGYL